MSFGDANYSLDTARELSGKKGRVLESGHAHDPSKKLDGRFYMEYNMRLNVADSLADYYNTDVHICPDFQAPQDEWRYPYFFKGIKPFSPPDFYFDKEYWELKGYEGKFNYDKVSKMIRRAMAQCDNIILKMDEDVNIRNVKQRALGFLQKSKNAGHVKKVLVIDVKNKVHVIK